ncbi:hypothetical protein BKA70DRAFT_1216851 [Coprinopsis sp. MPI-PUGE-AT-0042]|nr:hypothetical protein BKA70DRAFT_1216851 [Coprinopsis sp. MPI-PUGE-AT-0042]
MLPPQNYLAWKVCITALHAVATSTTFLRVRIRWKDARLWWDDYVAAAAALVDLAFAITFWLLFGTHATTSSINHRSAGSTTPLPVAKSGSLTIGLFFSVVWSSRVSLALSIMRVFPTGTVARKTLLAMAVLFFSAFILACVFIGSLCLGSPSTYLPETILLEEHGSCQPGTLRYIVAGSIMATADFLSDIMGVIIPLTFLWRITLPPNERCLVHGAIVATLLTVLSSVVHCIFWFVMSNLGEDVHLLVAGVRHQQAALSVVACNLLVVVTYWWRKVYRRNGPAPRRYIHNDPNIPTSKTSSQSPSFASGSRSDNEGNGTHSSTDPGRSFDLEDSSRLPGSLTLTPITPLSAESTSNPTIYLG